MLSLQITYDNMRSYVNSVVSPGPFKIICSGAHLITWALEVADYKHAVCNECSFGDDGSTGL